jgi:hypothetical protein
VLLRQARRCLHSADSRLPQLNLRGAFLQQMHRNGNHHARFRKVFLLIASVAPMPMFGGLRKTVYSMDVSVLL